MHNSFYTVHFMSIPFSFVLISILCNVKGGFVPFVISHENSTNLQSGVCVLIHEAVLVGTRLHCTVNRLSCLAAR